MLWNIVVIAVSSVLFCYWVYMLVNIHRTT
jgi:hypothetical protein